MDICKHTLEGVNGDNLVILDFNELEFLTIRDKDNGIVVVNKDDLPKLIGKLAEIAGQHIAGKAE